MIPGAVTIQVILPPWLPGWCMDTIYCEHQLLLPYRWYCHLRFKWWIPAVAARHCCLTGGTFTIAPGGGYTPAIRAV